ncbi:intercellular adhesion molecule 1-like [Pholidichthys leucotaenia]
MATMFFHFIHLAVYFLCTNHVSSCGQCKDKPVFSPASVVVMYGGPANATCVVCNTCEGKLETPLGNKEEKGATVIWKVDRMTEWDPNIQCYYLINNTDDHCCTHLPVTLYQPPENVSISFLSHTGPLLEGFQYTLLCTIQKVAPVKNLSVIFYKGEISVGHRQSDSQQKKPVNVTFTLNITASRKDDGAQYWCEAKLELGPDGPVPPPVVASEKLTATVAFEKILTSLPPTTTPVRTTTNSASTLSATILIRPTTASTTTRPSTTPNSGTDRAFIPSFVICFTLLFTALV